MKFLLVSALFLSSTLIDAHTLTTSRRMLQQEDQEPFDPPSDQPAPLINAVDFGKPLTRGTNMNNKPLQWVGMEYVQLYDTFVGYIKPSSKEEPYLVTQTFVPTSTDKNFFVVQYEPKNIEKKSTLVINLNGEEVRRQTPDKQGAERIVFEVTLIEGENNISVQAQSQEADAEGFYIEEIGIYKGKQFWDPNPTQEGEMDDVDDQQIEDVDDMDGDGNDEAEDNGDADDVDADADVDGVGADGVDEDDVDEDEDDDWQSENENEEIMADEDENQYQEGDQIDDQFNEQEQMEEFGDTIYTVNSGGYLVSSSSINGNQYNHPWLDYSQANYSCWSPSVNSAGQWIQVGSPHLREWLKVIIQGRGDKDEWVTKFKISYTTNGETFKYLEDGRVFEGNSDRNTKVEIKFKQMIEARTIRIIPVEWNNGIALRFDAIAMSNALEMI